MDVSEWIDRHAGLTPDKTAIRFPGRDDLSYAELAQQVGRFAAALARAGVARGHAVGYLGFNSPEMLALLFACARLGAMFMPLNWRLTAAEHRQVLDDCPPSVLFVEPPFIDQTDALGRSAPAMSMPAGVATRVAFGDAPSGWISCDAFLAGTGDSAAAAGAPSGTTTHRRSGAAPLGAPAMSCGCSDACTAASSEAVSKAGLVVSPDVAPDPESGIAAQPGSEIGPDTPLLICYTSGSTGKPKGVVLTQGALSSNAANSIDMHDLTADDRILTTLPLFHVGGLNNQTTPALYCGCTVVLHPKFDPEATFDAIERERITLTVLVPAQLDMLMAHPRWPVADLSSLRMITSGSTIVSEALIHAVNARGVPLIQVYGSTETCPIAVYLKAADAQRKAGSTGRAAKQCALRIVNEKGAAVATGVTGEIIVRGPNVMAGYWNAPQATAAALVDGWFHSGDMGHLDADGYLWVDGRKKDLIISGGENIYPAEIENVLIECGEIAEVSVVGRADPRWGEIVVAVVVAKPGHHLTREQLIGLLEGRVARFKHPKEVVFVDALPRTALGKVRKEDVRQLVAHHAASGFGFAVPS